MKTSKQRIKTTRAPNPAQRGAPSPLTDIEQHILAQKEEDVRELERILAAENERKVLIRKADLGHEPEVERRGLLGKLKLEQARRRSIRAQPSDVLVNLPPSVARVLNLLIAELREMREKFNTALHGHSFWPDEPDSVSARKGNARHFELNRKTWADAAIAALGNRFPQLVLLFIRKGSTKKRAVKQTQKILRLVIQEHCNMVPILEGISMPTLPASLPPGVGNENDGTQSLSNKFLQSMLSHLHETTEETLLRFDLDLISKQPMAQFQNSPERERPQGAVPAQFGESRRPAIIKEVARITSTKGTDWRSMRRGWLVAQVLEELRMIRDAEMRLDPEVSSDWETVVQRFKGRGFYLFPVVASSEELKFQVLGKMRGKPIGLAQAIVARGEKCRVGTVLDDWKKHMPDEYRDPNRVR